MMTGVSAGTFFGYKPRGDRAKDYKPRPVFARAPGACVSLQKFVSLRHSLGVLQNFEVRSSGPLTFRFRRARLLARRLQPVVRVPGTHGSNSATGKCLFAYATSSETLLTGTLARLDGSNNDSSALVESREARTSSFVLSQPTDEAFGSAWTEAKSKNNLGSTAPVCVSLRSRRSLRRRASSRAGPKSWASIGNLTLQAGAPATAFSLP